jgi:hypothetical protein
LNLYGEGQLHDFHLMKSDTCESIDNLAEGGKRRKSFCASVRSRSSAAQ